MYLLEDELILIYCLLADRLEKINDIFIRNNYLEIKIILKKIISLIEKRGD